MLREVCDTCGLDSDLTAFTVCSAGASAVAHTATAIRILLACIGSALGVAVVAVAAMHCCVYLSSYCKRVPPSQPYADPPVVPQSEFT